MALLRAVISPFILRRLKQQVLTELPDKTEIIHHISLSPKSVSSTRQPGAKWCSRYKVPTVRALMHVLSGLTRLRRLCCSPQLVMPEWSQASSKLDEAMALLEEAIGNGHRVLVFSQFVDLLSLLRARIEQQQWDYCYLDGGCSAKSRQESILRFRHEAVPLFLISLKAGAQASTSPRPIPCCTWILVEPGGGRSGERSGPPHGADPAGDRLSPGVRTDGGGEDRRPAR